MQQRDDRGLAGSGVADDGDGFAGFDGEGHIAENPVGLGGSSSRALLGLDGSETRPHMAIASWLVWSRATRPRSCRFTGTSRYANQTWSNSIRPGPVGVLVTAGEVISAGVSSNLKTRSLAAIADCRMLYFSLKS